MRIDKSKDGAETLRGLGEWIKECGELYIEIEEYLSNKSILKAVKNDWSYIPTLSELEDFYNGVCSRCHGEGKIQIGYRDGSIPENNQSRPEDYDICPKCMGTGKVNTKC
jgi:hypothetical protein